MSFFYGVYPQNRGVRAFLSLLRFVAQPSAIRAAHITLRGPYDRIDINDLADYRAQAFGFEHVTITKPISLFSDDQNTVALEVDVGDLRRLWYKPSYPEGVGHITMYDGADQTEANWVYDALNQYRWKNIIEVSEIDVIERKASIDAGLLQDRVDIFALYGMTEEISLPSLERVIQLTFPGRMSIYRSILKFFSEREDNTPYLLRA